MTDTKPEPIRFAVPTPEKLLSLVVSGDRNTRVATAADLVAALEQNPELLACVVVALAHTGRLPDTMALRTRAETAEQERDAARQALDLQTKRLAEAVVDTEKERDDARRCLSVAANARDELRDRLSLEQRYHDETHGYRQKAEQDRDDARADVARYTHYIDSLHKVLAVTREDRNESRAEVERLRVVVDAAREVDNLAWSMDDPAGVERGAEIGVAVSVLLDLRAALDALRETTAPYSPPGPEHTAGDGVGLRRREEMGESKAPETLHDAARHAINLLSHSEPGHGAPGPLPDLVDQAVELLERSLAAEPSPPPSDGLRDAVAVDRALICAAMSQCDARAAGKPGPDAHIAAQVSAELFAALDADPAPPPSDGLREAVERLLVWDDSEQRRQWGSPLKPRLRSALEAALASTPKPAPDGLPERLMGIGENWEHTAAIGSDGVQAQIRRNHAAQIREALARKDGAK